MTKDETRLLTLIVAGLLLMAVVYTAVFVHQHIRADALRRTPPEQEAKP